MDSNGKYLDMITSQYADKPKYNLFVAAFLDMLSPVVDCFKQFNDVFNLDTAVGDQLDRLGAYVDMTRELPVNDPDIPSILTDELFRLVIKSRIYANHWDGTTYGLSEIIKKIFAMSSFELIDNQDMTITVNLVDPSASLTTIALLFNGYIIPKPEGVSIAYYIQDKGIFGYDMDTEYVTGWDSGIWADS